MQGASWVLHEVAATLRTELVLDISLLPLANPLRLSGSFAPCFTPLLVVAHCASSSRRQLRAVPSCCLGVTLGGAQAFVPSPADISLNWTIFAVRGGIR